ncbi:MAG: hypothetical protein U9Q97_08920, partial [Acidobacteriota bacterium]|nr:hypothetical protein [Acidobacteriota bacterium]
MMDLIAKHTIKRIMKILALIAIGVAIGYFWHYQAVAYEVCMSATHAAGWVASAQIKKAMLKMGPRYSYMM